MGTHKIERILEPNDMSFAKYRELSKLKYNKIIIII